MVSLAQLWLPILLSGIGAFVASSIMHMVLQFWHRPDYHMLPNEDEVRAAVRKASPPPGMYLIPYCPPETMKDPAAVQKFTEGPIGFLILRPNGMPNLGKNLSQWFGFCLLVGLFSAYLAGATLAAGTAPMQVFRVVATAAFLAFGFGVFPMAIWWGQPWRAAIKDLVDGLIYALVVAAVFAWLWPR